jgi:cupin 2 domain-containing protein
MLARGNLFAGLAAIDPREPHPAGEQFEPLLARPGLLLERIVSRGQASPPDFWYDQPRDEWVVLLGGAAGLEIAGEAGVRTLAPGDWVLLPAHCRHRVAWTAAAEATVWLALHVAPEEPAPTSAGPPEGTP